MFTVRIVLTLLYLIVLTTRLPPSSKPTDTLFPYTPLFRSYARRQRRRRDRESRSRPQRRRRRWLVRRERARVVPDCDRRRAAARSEERTSELQSNAQLVCRLLLEKKKNYRTLLAEIQL